MSKTPRGGECAKFFGGRLHFPKNIYIFGIFLFFLRGGGDGRPKNGGMEMDDPKKLMCFGANTRVYPIFASFFGGGTFSLYLTGAT